MSKKAAVTTEVFDHTAPAAMQQLAERYERFPIQLFFESPLNPRRTFRPDSIAEMAESIRQKGIIEPLVARPAGVDNDTLEIVAGARRFRGAALAGLTHLPAVVRNYSDVQVVEIMAIENGQREDVPPLEEAAGYKQLLLIDQTYTAAKIAERTGHSERYIWDRLKLLDLVPEAQELLATGRMGVEHAEVIAKQKPSDQDRIIHPTNGGLFEHTHASLEFEPGHKKHRLDDYKLRTVRELKSWIQRHVRFDVEHQAAAAPLEFGPVAKQIEETIDQRDDDRAVISITDEQVLHPDTQRKEKTYVASSWRRADGKEKSKPCEYALLGVMVTGKRRGQAFEVCIAREKCRTHWEPEIKQREKNAKLRAKGQGSKASQNEVTQRQKEQQRRLELQAQQEAWRALEPAIVADALAQTRKVKALTAAQAKVIKGSDLWSLNNVLDELGPEWFKAPIAAWLAVAIVENGCDSVDEFFKDIAKPLGLDVRRLEAIRDTHFQKSDEKTAPSGKGKKR